jgi:hypothetical protein
MNPCIYPDDSIYPAVKNHKFHSNGKVHGAFKFGAASSQIPIVVARSSWLQTEELVISQSMRFFPTSRVVMSHCLRGMAHFGANLQISGVRLHFLHLHH